MNVTKRLQHLAQLSKTTQVGTPADSMWGDRPNITSVSTIACFAYQDTENVSQQDIPASAKRRWTILLAKDQSEVEEGDRITSITTKLGEVVCSGGRVVDILILTRYDRGIDCRLVTVDPN